MRSITIFAIRTTAVKFYFRYISQFPQLENLKRGCDELKTVNPLKWSKLKTLKPSPKLTVFIQRTERHMSTYYVKISHVQLYYYLPEHRKHSTESLKMTFPLIAGSVLSSPIKTSKSGLTSSKNASRSASSPNCNVYSTERCAVL